MGVGGESVVEDCDLYFGAGELGEVLLGDVVVVVQDGEFDRLCHVAEFGCCTKH